MGTRNPPGRKKGTKKTGGRQAGTPNKATTEIKAFCQSLFERPAFRKNLLKAWDDLSLDASYRNLLTHYGFGKPKEHVELEAGATLAQLLADISGHHGTDE